MKKSLFMLLFSAWLLNMSSQNHWKQLGNTTSNDNNIRSLFNDTIAHKLYVGGSFQSLGGKACFNIAQWDGVAWDTLGYGLDSSVYTSGGVYKILRYKNKLYAMGQFSTAGLKPIRAMASWDGTQWDSIVGQSNGTIFDADIYQDTMYVSGNFTRIGNVNTNLAAKFDGTNWYPISFPFSGEGGMYSIRAFKNKVYGTGSWYFNGFSLTAEYTPQGGWTPSFGVQGPSTKDVSGLERIDSLLFFYGRFTHISTMYGPDIVAWSGNKLYSFSGPDPASVNSVVHNVKKINGKIYAMGTFDNINGLSSGPFHDLGIAELNGNHWCIDDYVFSNDVVDAVSYNDTLVIAGPFRVLDGDSMSLVAKWMQPSFSYSCNVFYTGINEITVSESIKIYPNPAASILTIEDEQNELQGSTIEVINYLGQSVLSVPYTPKFDISKLPAGCYTLRIASPHGQSHYAKFIRE